GAAAALFTTGTARAEHQMNWNWGDRFHYDSEGKDLYSAQEFTFDIFGTYSKGKEKFNDTFDKTLRHGDFGGGIGVNYFITRNFGIGTDAFAGDNGGDFVDAVSASAILRLPIDVAHLAPYVFAGGGRQFDGPDSWNLHVGVGLEFRLSSYTGIFIDGRHVFHVSDKSSDYALIRSGLRFAF
ncbi:MAG: hypothetical protein ABI042_14525, partial [Verrucomicrobiota bacterium]